ncbi:inositol polyphosphate multikinase [Osmerus mordax]|uniref:inositol polyphosphate multikinase n=1 Tax=Osmerus mordax TaxID=8014 RepID=UPI00350FDCA7
MSTQHQIMDSSLALGRLELNSPMVKRGTRLSGGPVKEKSVQPSLQAHLNGCVPLSHQVAGHKYGVDKVGILQHPDGTVLKQLQPPPRGPREMQFYSMVCDADCRDPCLLELQKHLPKYFGTWSYPDTPNDLYLKLEDVTRRFHKPCIMDVKIGQRSYDPFASQEKRDQQVRKYPLMEEIGFLVLGMRVYKLGSDSYDSYDQHYGRGLVKDTIRDGLSKFFHNGLGLRRDAVSASILKVQKILQWFEEQSQLTFYASSLLFVYEGLPTPNPSPGGLLHHPRTPLENNATSLLAADGDADQEEEVVEYNNNVQVGVPLDYSQSTTYAMHKKCCPKGHHHGKGPTVNPSAAVGDEDITAPNAMEDNTAWKRPDATEQPNGNGCQGDLEGEGEEGVEQGEGDEGSASEEQEKDGLSSSVSGEVEVRMIDFAHVFPSESQDHGYIYGLRHLLMVLQQILDQP